uniref:Zinc finger, SWIM-type containing 8 n=1 Tax=Eptatretus burgeri TaxID=7764 RepID=A0A8C4WVP5_EPTBU
PPRPPYPSRRANVTHVLEHVASNLLNFTSMKTTLFSELLLLFIFYVFIYCMVVHSCSLTPPPTPPIFQCNTQGKKVKVSTHKQTLQATGILAKAAFLITVLSERSEHHGLAFVVGLFALELQRPPASTKALEVRLAYQESEIVSLLKKIPLGPAEMAVIRERAAQLREGCFCDYRPVLPLMLASFIFDVLCSPVVSSTGSRPPSRNRTSQQPGDEELGFEAAITALGLKTTVSEAEHPLLCEGTRRQKGELALALLITYKDDQVKLKKILDKLLDRESQTHKPQTLSSFYSSSGKPPNQKSPSKHASHSSTTTAAVPSSSSAPHASCVSGGLSLPLANTQNTEGFSEDLVTAAYYSPLEGCPQHAYKQDGKVSGRLVFGSRGFFNGRSWGSPIRPKKKHTGMASIDSSAPETTSDSSPTLSRRPLPPRGGWGCGSWGRGQDSDSISSSSSDSLGSSSSSGSLSTTGPRGKGTEGARYKGRRAECHAPHVPNQPSEAAAHFYFELAKTVLVKAGGNSSTSLFTHPAASGGHQGPHRNLHLSAFEIGLYALGLHNFVSPNWLSRTYSSHVSWITGQAMEIGSAALNILVDCWDGHLTPPEVASLADRASRARDANMVRAAAELALSCLPHAHALNPNEIQRALLQCKEQDSQMLEKACIAVEEAAKGGGVYPEVLFDVAHQWHWLFEQTLGGSSAGGGGGGGSESRPQSNHSEAGHIEHDAVLGPTAVHARLPGNSPNCSRAQSVVSGIHPAFLPTQYQYPSTGVPHTALPPPPIAVPLQPVPPVALHQPFAADHGLPLTPGAESQSTKSFKSLFGIKSKTNCMNVYAKASIIVPCAGMLALEMLGRRAHSDHPNNIFSRTPPYTEDVKWLLGLAVKLGISHVQQFCMGAAKGLLSPFVLQELIVEALQFLSRTNPTGLHSHLRSPALSQLIQRCQQTFRQCIEHRLYHISPVDYDDFVGLICCARTAFFLTPVGVGQFNEVLQGLRRSKYCKKELYQRIFAEMPTYTA